MIEIKNLKKAYENVTPIECLNVTINKGDVISLIGPSGTGKSTLLRMINALEKPTSGQIIIDGDDITKPGYPLNKLRQKVGMVFQSFNLFNHMTVIENVCFAPIELKNIPPKEAYEIGMKHLEDVGLANFALSYPASLSGGQKQRVAIARALAMDPEVILFDEPTSALDPTMVGEVQAVIKNLANQGHTMLLVTHDMSFAENVANRILFLADGELYEDGTPEEIFHHPKKEKTKAFVKRLNNLFIEIDNKQYDFMSLYSAIDVFALKCSMDGEICAKLKAILEELSFGIIMPIIKESDEERPRFILEICYSVTDKNAIVNAEWRHIDFDPKDEEYALQMTLIKHYAKSYELIDENHAVLTIEK